MKKDSQAAVFVEPPAIVSGLTLRPLTAGTLILLRQTDNKLISGKAGAEGVEYEVAAFLWIHGGDAVKVRKSAKNAETFREAVLSFADTLTVPEFTAAANQIQEIITQATAGMTYEVEGADDGPK